MPENIKSSSRARLLKYSRPWVFVCPRSDTYAVRQVPDGIWAEAAKKINGTVFWIGRHPGPPGLVDLECRHFETLMHYLSVADLLLTVDTGPMHVAAAFGVPIIAISQSSSPELHLNDQNDFVAISPKLDCLNCQLNVCPINAHIPPCQQIESDLISQWANARSLARTGDSVSAIVSIYQPEVGVLNKCLEHVLNQVSEVIITVDKSGKIPNGAMIHPKVKYVHHSLSNIGYGRKQNFGARHSNGRFLLLLNDDVFLAPDAVEKMVASMTPTTGMTSNLLRYPDGTIYHAGKRRSPGQRGWGHIDLRKYHPSITEPCEMENVCGACVMVRREAFYQIGGFDEDFFLYAEDDDMALRMRHAGWGIRYTPHSTGVHMEHQSTQKTANISHLVNNANATFNRKWGPYLEWNLNRVPGNFDYLKT